MKEENIRAEYNAISAKLNQLPSFRFALAGFYVAAVGVIASTDNPTEGHFFLLIGLTIALWLVDLRTRGLLTNIGKRGVQIERGYWGYDGWISRMRRQKPDDDKEESQSSEVESDSVKIFFWKMKLPHFVSHSLGFDLLFFLVLLYSAYRLLTL